MLPINYSRYKYTPDEMPQVEFLERFVVRTEIFDNIFEDIKSSDYKVANQHYIIMGQRGQGKTTLLRKLQIEIENDKKLSNFLLPVKFAEEQYQIRSLSRLWEEVADYLQSIHEDVFPHVLDDMEEHFEDDDYELKAFSYLESALKKKKKKLLLLIDNIDELIGKLNEKEQRRLREILLSSSSFRIVGGSTKMLEQHYDYGKPFYEFFKIIKLKGFTKAESIEFLRSIGKGEQKEKMEAIIKNNSARIETLRQLTGGVPRTLVMLFDIFLDEEGNAFDDLLKVLDEATPLYKHRIDELPSQLQEIVHTIAINWDGMYTADIAKKTRLSTKIISAQLGKLEKYDIVESEVAGKNKIYKIKERFFNIWYLMRFGRKKDRQRVEWLVKFLQSWCTKVELNERAENLIKKIDDGDLSDEYIYCMSNALIYAGVDAKLKTKLENIFNEETSKYGNKESSYYQHIAKYGTAMQEMYRPERIGDMNNFMSNLWVRAICHVLDEEFESSYKSMMEVFSYTEHKNYEKMVSSYLTLLMAYEQYHRTHFCFDFQDLKEQFKPIWYALMTLMQDEFPHEIKKMGSELQESVDEVLKRVEEDKKEYV